MGGSHILFVHEHGWLLFGRGFLDLVSLFLFVGENFYVHSAVGDFFFFFFVSFVFFLFVCPYFFGTVRSFGFFTYGGVVDVCFVGRGSFRTTILFYTG